MTFEITLPVLWRGPVPNESGGMRRPVHGVVQHIMLGTLWGTDGWFHNKQAQASSDYGVGKDGTIIQWVDWTYDWKAWAEAAGNPYWVSIENEGFEGDALTPQQIEANAQIIAHVFMLDGVPFVTTDDVNGYGLGWHGMGGADWGNHPDCPGKPILAQRGEVLARAMTLAGGGTPVDPNTPNQAAREMEVKFGIAQDPESGGSWKVRLEDGAIYADDGAPFLGGLNGHPDWKASADATNGENEVQGIVACKDPQGQWGYKIWVYFGSDKNLHPYLFPRNGSLA